MRRWISPTHLFIPKWQSRAEILKSALASDFDAELVRLRRELELVKREYYARKAGFNPNQPRVPVGNSDGGQWTSGGGGSATQVRLADASNILGSLVMSDASPDPIIPGAQYAQTEITIHPSALTGMSTIDDTTKKLASTLATVVDALPEGSGAVYGIVVHTAFAHAVRMQRILGIGFSDVETTFSLADSFRYGSKDSIRTDVILRNDVGDIVAIYDVKTGGATIRPSRADELRAKTRVGSEVPVMELSLRRGVVLKSALATAPWNRRGLQSRIHSGVIHVYGA